MNQMDRQREQVSSPKEDRLPSPPNPIAVLAHPLPNGPGAAERLALMRHLGALAGEKAPSFSDALAAIAAKRFDAALAALTALLAQDPALAEAWVQKAVVFTALQRFPEARAAAERAVSLRPLDAGSQAALGYVLSFMGDDALAAAACGRAVALDPACAPAHLYRAKLLRRLGQTAGGLASIDAYGHLQPDDPEGRIERGHLLMEAGRPGEAEAAYRHALGRDPGAGEALLGLGRSLVERGDMEAAVAAIEAGIGAVREAGKLYTSLGLLHQKRSRFQPALDAFRRAMALAPDDPMTSTATGLLFQGAGHNALAIPFFEHALRLQPDSLDALFQLAEAHRALGQHHRVLALCGQALRLAPDSLLFRALACWARMYACAWDGFETEVQGLLDTALAGGKAVSPFLIVALGRSNLETLLWNRAWASQEMPVAPPLATGGERAPGPLRVGYLSSDFRQHPAMHLILDLFRHHDRDRFELFGYKSCREGGTAVEREAEGLLGSMVDLTGMEDGEAARRIHADRLDILVDITGYTAEGRYKILAHRPAPLQVSFMGYPASMGTPHLDYLIADAVVAPAEHQPFFDEGLVHMPHSYQPNDRTRAGADPAARRQDHGLPAEGLVFCCFNNSFKLTPLMFDIWMRLLDAVPGAVLWLLHANDDATANLRAVAGARGVDPARLVFAPRVPAESHLGRLGLADLFLDTLPYNAHTTCSEALWCGVPVLTCMGEQFASRVAASLLFAVGLPDLVTTSLATYEAEALALARDPARLAALRARLVAGRDTAPLFDSLRYTRDFESALGHMVARRCAGQAPGSFAVAALAGTMP